MTTDANDELKTETPLTDMSGEHDEIETRPDLLWDKEAPGLCIRVHGDGSTSFILVYRVDDRQRFVRIGRTPMWPLEAARKRAKELHGVIDQGGDREIYNHERDKARSVDYERYEVRPVEDVIRYIAEELGRKP
jgi:Arm DNA-binding domain